MVRTELIVSGAINSWRYCKLSPNWRLASRLLCRRVRWTAQLMEDSALLSVPARIAKRLLSLAHLHGRGRRAEPS
jgi:hypothetical protein